MSWSEYPAARVIGEFEDLLPEQPPLRRAPPSSPLLVPYAMPVSAAVWDDIPLATDPPAPTNRMASPSPAGEGLGVRVAPADASTPCHAPPHPSSASHPYRDDDDESALDWSRLIHVGQPASSTAPSTPSADTASPSTDPLIHPTLPIAPTPARRCSVAAWLAAPAGFSRRLSLASHLRETGKHPPLLSTQHLALSTFPTAPSTPPTPPHPPSGLGWARQSVRCVA